MYSICRYILTILSLYLIDKCQRRDHFIASRMNFKNDTHPMPKKQNKAEQGELVDWNKQHK